MQIWWYDGRTTSYTIQSAFDLSVFGDLSRLIDDLVLGLRKRERDLLHHYSIFVKNKIISIYISYFFLAFLYFELETEAQTRQVPTVLDSGRVRAS